MDINHITLLNGPQKVAPFSHAVRAGNLLFITGQMPTLMNNKSKLISGGIEEQTHQVMKNLIDVLKGCNSSLKKVIFSRLYLVNFKDFVKMYKIYASYFYKKK
mgnify:FL=1